MGISGLVAGGMDDALEQVLERRLREQLRQQQERQHQDQIGLQRDTLASANADRAADNERETKRINLAELKRTDDLNREQTDRNVGMDAANVLQMPGMSKEAQANELQQSVLRNPNASSAPGMLKVIEGLTKIEKPARDPIADHRAMKQIDQEFEKPAKPDKPGLHVIDGSLVDDNGHVRFQSPGKPNPNAPDPAKAAEIQQKILDTAKKLRDSPGRSALTGQRVMNPAYGFGFTNEPVAGTKAANAKALFDTLKSVMTLENLGLLKGAMSDKDLLFLKSAGSSLESSMDDPSFLNELNSIITKVETKMTPAASHESAPASNGDPRVDALLKKYGGG